MQVQVSGRRLSFPRMCACCGAPPQTEYAATAVRVTGKRVVRTQEHSWPIPYCYNCIQHVSEWPKDWGCGVALLALITCLFWIPIQLIIDANAKTKARKLCNANCCAPTAAAAYLGWNGTIHSFDFVALRFAYEFILANSGRIINLPYAVEADLQRYVAYKTTTQYAPAPPPQPGPTPTVASSINSTSDDERIVSEALAKIETAKGPAGRRNALESALARIQSTEQRMRLLKEAAGIEVHAVLDKVDSLKTPAAKRRHIEAALAQLRSDPIPDELQAQEIAWLENALRDLDAGKNQ